MYRNFLFLLLLAACTQRSGLPIKNELFINQNGQIVVEVCGRGCAQYLLKTGGVLYAPQNLPAEYKIDHANVKFSGEPLRDSTVINTFGPDDRLIPKFKIRNLNITQIVKQ
jgi:hypothetical protein